MKPISIVLLSVVLSIGAAGLVVAVLAPASEPEVRGSEPAPHSAEVDELRREIAAQREALSDLAERLEQKSAMSIPAASTTRAPVTEDVEAIVRRVLDEQSTAKDAVLAVAEDESDSPFSSALTAAEIADMLTNGGGYPAVEGYWQGLRKRGVASADILAAFESFAAAHPNDPEAQVMLGNAYIQRLNESASGPEMGQWAMKADGAYEAALTLDDTNWDARFAKAISLSFWPPIFGKQGEAINQFEILLEQQRKGPAQPEYAETYVLLGNLYQQQGDVEKAKATWQEGYDLFPDDDGLGEKVNAIGK